jgi:hypothetical protein
MAATYLKGAGQGQIDNNKEGQVVSLTPHLSFQKHRRYSARRGNISDGQNLS